MSSTRATRTRRVRRRSVADLLPTFERGRPSPLGATVDDGGVNFAVYSEDATRVELLLFATGENRPVWECPECGRLSADGGKCPLDGTKVQAAGDGVDADEPPLAIEAA